MRRKNTLDLPTRFDVSVLETGAGDMIWHCYTSDGALALAASLRAQYPHCPVIVETIGGEDNDSRVPIAYSPCA